MRRTIPFLVLALVIAVPVAGLVAERYLPGAGVWVGAIVALGIIKELWPSRSHVDAWASGAAGEAKVGSALERLGPGFVVLHDRRIPGSRANIDHIVVGPTGIFIVETKNVAGRVTIQNGELRVRGRRRDFAAEAWREAGAVQTVSAIKCAAWGFDVKPLLCFTKAELPWRKTLVEGIPLLNAKGAVATIQDAPAKLEPHQVSELARLIDGSLRAA